MDRFDPQRAEPAGAVGLLGVALVLFAVGTATAALLPAAIAAVLALDAWRRAERRRRETDAALALAHADVARLTADVVAERERVAQDAERHREDRERLGTALRRAEEALSHQRELGRRLQASRQAEREWNRELRGQIQRLADTRGGDEDGEHGDVRDLVLRTAIQLVEAQKGLLLSRTDADGDGALDLIVAHGFEHDPEDSAVVQRFARQVLASDEILREDDPVAGGHEATAADEEIDGLVAIPLYLRDRFHGVIICANRQGGFEDLDDDVLLALGDHAGAALHHGQLHNELHESRRAIVRALSEAVAARDLELHRESTELTLHALALARELELDEHRRDALICATLLRHVGYLALPERPFAESRELRPDERAVVELHTRIGFNVVGQVPALRDVAGAILYHHERYDGNGYPAGLAGEAIPLVARALAVLEAYGAMTFDRSYRARMSPEEACEQIVAAAGTQFDPEIAQRFVELIRSGPLAVDETLADHVIEALPLNLTGQAGAGLGSLDAGSVDGLTLLGNQRALHRDLLDAAREADPDSGFAVALLQLEELARVNEDISYPAGDHLIQVAARNAQRTAARFGGTAYRASGRRLAVLAPLNGSHGADDVVNGLLAEFASGPEVRAGVAVWRPGDRASDVVARARRSLLRPQP